jgi:hypothetical protein
MLLREWELCAPSHSVSRMANTKRSVLTVIVLGIWIHEQNVLATLLARIESVERSLTVG